MLSHELVIDGTAYVRSRDAARAVGLTSDYLTKLARGSVIAGIRRDGLWYVSLASLEKFVVDGTSNLTYFTGALIAPVSATAGGWTNDGTQSYLIDTTDKVGIGTTTPWAKLSVAQTQASTPSPSAPRRPPTLQCAYAGTLRRRRVRHTR
jgi:hypothetical protein